MKNKDDEKRQTSQKSNNQEERGKMAKTQWEKINQNTRKIHPKQQRTTTKLTKPEQNWVRLVEQERNN